MFLLLSYHIDWSFECLIISFVRLGLFIYYCYLMAEGAETLRSRLYRL